MKKLDLYPNLPDIIREVQKQLVEAQRLRIKDGDSKFLKLKQVEFEMKCVAVENTEVDGGFDLKVVKLGSKLSEQQQQVHTVKIIFEGMSRPENSVCPQCGGSNMYLDKTGVVSCDACGFASCG
jgi:tRNA(Ile2) C34 agmatinyltransferase TiaS